MRPASLQYRSLCFPSLGWQLNCHPNECTGFPMIAALPDTAPAARPNLPNLAAAPPLHEGFVPRPGSRRAIGWPRRSRPTVPRRWCSRKPWGRPPVWPGSATMFSTPCWSATSRVNWTPWTLSKAIAPAALRSRSSCWATRAEQAMAALCYEVGADGYVPLGATTRNLIWVIARAVGAPPTGPREPTARHGEQTQQQRDHQEAACSAGAAAGVAGNGKKGSDYFSGK